MKYNAIAAATNTFSLWSSTWTDFKLMTEKRYQNKETYYVAHKAASVSLKTCFCRISYFSEHIF